MRRLLGLFLCSSMVFLLSFVTTGCGKDSKTKTPAPTATKVPTTVPTVTPTPVPSPTAVPKPSPTVTPKPTPTPIPKPEPKDVTHSGTFLEAKDDTFKMEDKDGDEHSHKLAPTGTVWNLKSDEIKLADLKKGQTIEVTTKEGDKLVAHKVKVTKDVAAPPSTDKDKDKDSKAKDKDAKEKDKDTKVKDKDAKEKDKDAGKDKDSKEKDKAQLELPRFERNNLWMTRPIITRSIELAFRRVEDFS